MNKKQRGEYDEFLMLVLGVIGLALTSLFLVMPALRVFYAVVMPAVIAGGAFLTWGLLYAARTGILAWRPGYGRPLKWGSRFGESES